MQQKNRAANQAFYSPTMSNQEFKRFSEFIYAQCGIKMSPAKKAMLTARLLKRLRDLGLTSYSEYYDYVSSPHGRSKELARMIDVVTTNKTEFFREAEHFDFLTKNVLPLLAGSKQTGNMRRLNIWSAGCSSGEEAYTLAMVLAEFFLTTRPLDKFAILATDISTQMLATAKKAIYLKKTVEQVPAMWREKYLMRGKNSQKELCRVVPELRNCITFRHLNFMDKDFGIRPSMDIIFCRNVVIYFDQQTQRKLFEKFYDQLVPGGYLFIGHSESLHGINERFQNVDRAMYRKPE
ncbi:MAG TPA: protein-glutamate O-methyltransferase [Anaerolineae bacterium]|nr:protein-glutamate O-methyltransferase [Anaerolineae bacterium]